MPSNKNRASVMSFRPRTQPVSSGDRIIATRGAVSDGRAGSGHIELITETMAAPIQPSVVVSQPGSEQLPVQPVNTAASSLAQNSATPAASAIFRSTPRASPSVSFIEEVETPIAGADHW